jgi:hypothetical protein
MVTAACQLLEQRKWACVFLTWTLPEVVIRYMADHPPLRSSWNDVFRRELRRHLRAVGLPGELVGVVEIQPERLQKRGEFAPHWHFLFENRCRPNESWRLGPEDFDRILQACIKRVTSLHIDVPAASRVESIRKSVGGYMARYVKKGLSPKAALALESAELGLVPTQWWILTDDLRAEVLSRVLPLDPVFLKFTDANRASLVQQGLIYSNWVFIDSAKRWMHSLKFPDLRCLREVIAQFEADVLDFYSWSPPGSRYEHFVDTGGRSFA